MERTSKGNVGPAPPPIPLPHEQLQGSSLKKPSITPSNKREQLLKQFQSRMEIVACNGSCRTSSLLYCAAVCRATNQKPLITSWPAAMVTNNLLSVTQSETGGEPYSPTSETYLEAEREDGKYHKYHKQHKQQREKSFENTNVKTIPQLST
jgi:hypothetical protein